MHSWGVSLYHMADVATRLRPAEPPHDPDAPSPEEIRAQLRDMLASPAFHRSTRCQQFLEYVCEKSLSGEAGQLKERTVATEVFGRVPESDLGEDTIVRVGAREVRKRLAQYYVTPEGGAARVRIDLPSGSYAPEFRYADAKEYREPPVEVRLPKHFPERHRSRLRIGVAVAGVAFAALAIAALMTRTDPATREFDKFWGPVIDSTEPMLLAVGHPLVYHPSSRALRLSESRLPPPPLPMQRPVQLAPEEITGSDLVPIPNQYVGFGDMVAATEVASMLGQRSKGVRVRLASGVQFADLKQAPSLLVGAITNRWTMELGQSWRFQFTRTADLKNFIVDTATPGRHWQVTSGADGLTAADYILLCRIRNSTTGSLIMVAAGVKQFGTEAAGRLLIDPRHLGTILGKLAPGWENRNLQVVLQVNVIGNTPAQPTVVASHVW